MVVAAVLGLLAFGAQAASAADLYLAPTGVNSGNCQSEAAPCSSVSYVQSQASATPGADTVHLGAGDYSPPDASALNVANVAWVGPQAGVPADEQTGPTARVQVPPGGFAFIVQTNGISFDGLTFQSLNYAASDGSFGVYNLNPTTVRNTVFTHVLTGIYAGSAITVSGVALDTASDAMYATGASATISNTRFSPPPTYAGLVSGAGGPITVTDSNFTGGTYGFLTYAGSSPATLTGNRFSPSIPNGLYNDGSPVDATNNWWGCNTGPNTSGCGTLTGPAAGTTTSAPYLQLDASAAPNPVDAGATAVVTGSLNQNSAGDPVAVGFPGSSVAFATTYGTLAPASAPLASGAATTTLTAPNAGGTADLTATLDNQTVHAPLVVSDVPPTITVDGDVTTARSGTPIAVSGVGNPGSTVQVEVNQLPVGLPVTVANDGTWSSSVTLVDGDNVLRVVQGTQAGDGPTVVGLYAPIVSSPQAGDDVPRTARITGTGLAGATVDVADENGTVIGNATVGSGGGFTVTTDPLPIGPHTLHLTQTTDGVTSTETTVAVTALPDAPVLTSPTHGASLTTGVVHFVGTALPDADVTVTTTLGGPIASGSADGSGDFDLTSSPIVPGTYSFVVVQASAGLTSPASAPITVTVTAPDPTIEVDRTDATTGETVHLSGTGDPGATLQIRNDGTPVGTATVDTDGSWSADVTVADGANDFDVVQYGTQTSPVVTVHGYSPPAVVRPSPNAQVRSTFTIRGDGTTGSPLTVTDEHGTEIGRTTPTACGCWSLTTTVPLADGPHTLTISQTAGGSVRSTTLTVVVDPNALEVTAPIDLLPVRAEGLRFTGSGAPGATISIYVEPDSTTPAAIGTAGPDGAFDIPLVIAPGFANVAVTQTPVGGSESDPIELNLILLLNPPTIAVDGPTTVAEGDMIAVSGTAEPDAHVVLYDNETAITDVVADGDGAWSGSLPALAGDNAITVMQVVLGPNQAVSDVSDPVHATGVGAPSVSAPLAGDHVQTRFDVAGSALPGATVTIADGSTVLGTATADATTGAWSTTTTTPLAYGARTLDVRQQLDGATGPDRSVAVAVVPSAPVLTHPDGDELGDGSIPVAGTADPDADVDVFLDGSSSPAASTSAEPDGDFAVDVAAGPGSHAVRVSQRVGTSLSGPLSAARSIEVLPPRPTLHLDSDPTTAAGDPIAVSGHALPGATVLVDREAPSGTVRTFSTTADAVSGAWSTTFPAASRTNTISARQQADGLGTPSNASPSVVVTATPLLDPPPFTLPTDARTGSLTITGTARPGATVSGTFGGVAKSATADGDGAWSVAVTVHPGAQTASFQQSAVVDGTTETSDDSAVQTLTGVAAPAVTAPDEDATVGASFAVTGTVLPTAVVTVTVDGLPLLPVTADVAGSFSVSVLDLDIGLHTISVTQTHGAVTGDPTVVHVRVPPAAPSFDAPPGFVTGSVQLTGTALPDAAIKIYDGGGSSPVAAGTADEHGAYEIAFTPATGTHQLTVTQTVASVESAPSAAHDVTVWPTPLTVAADAAVVPLGGSTTLSGNAMPGATVIVSAAGSGDTIDSTTADATTGHWSATFTLPAGVNALDVVQELAGNRGETVSGPTVTVLAAPTIDPLASPVDATPSLSGMAPPNVTVVVEDEDGQPLGSTDSNGSGEWSLTLTTALTPGNHTLTAHARLDGVDGPASAGRAVSVRPGAPVMTSPSGAVATDGSIRFRGTAVPEATVTAYDTGSGIPSVLASGTADASGAYDFSVYVAPASYTVAVGQTVGSAPASVLSPTASVSVSIPAPTLTRSGSTVRAGSSYTVGGSAWPAATVRISVGGSEVETATAASDGSWSAELTATAGDQTLTAVQNRFDTDSPASAALHVFGLTPPTIATPVAGATVGRTFTLTGSGEPDATVTIRDDAATPIGTGSVDGDGHWSVTTTTALVPGTRGITAEQTLDGTTSAAAARAFEVQPPVPSLATPADGDRGAGSVRFSGTAMPNAIIDVQDGATTLSAAATADGSGAFSGSVALAVGVHAVTITQRVGSSIASEPTATRTLAVLPDAPTLTGPAEVTTGAAIALSGSARPNATITVLRGGTPVATTPGTVTANGDGDWTATVTAVDGDNVLTATQTSDALESPASSARHVTGVGSAVVATPAAGGRVGPTFTLTGTGLAGATVTARNADDAVLGTATVAGNGSWSLTTTVPLAPGSRAVTVSLRTAGGTDGAPVTRTFAVVPAAPTATAADGTSPITVSGHALPGAAVTVSEGASVVATGTAGGTGGFSIPVALAPGAHELTVTQRAAEGGTSDPSAPVRVTVTTPGGPPTPTTPTEPTTPTPTTPVPPTVPPAVTPPTLPNPPSQAFGIASKTARKTTVLLGLRFPVAGRVTVTATIQVRGEPTTYATVTTSVRGPRTKRIAFRPSRKAKAALAKRKAARVTITVTFTPTGGKPVRKTTTVTVKVPGEVPHRGYPRAVVR